MSRRSAIAGAVLAGLSGHPVRAGVRRVRIGQTNGAPTPSGLACAAFAAAVAAHPLLQHAMRVEVNNDGALGDELFMLRGTLDGTVDVVLTSTGPASILVPELGLLDAAFLFRDAATARAALDGGIGADLMRLAQAKGVNLLAWAENGMRQITANRPIHRPSDLAGLKVRVPQSDVEMASFRALGANPVALPFPVLYEALRTGDVDAQENPIGNIESARFWEVQKYLSLTRHIYSANIFVAAKDLLDDLSEEQQAALADCAVAGAAASRQAADKAEREGVARLQAAGMTVVTDIDTASFMAAAKPNLAALGQKYGPALMDRMIRAGT